MDLQIRPEPTTTERQAIELALAQRASRDGRRVTSQWHAEGVRENTTGDQSAETCTGVGRTSGSAPERR